MIIGKKNEPNILTKDKCQCKCKFDGIKCNRNKKRIMINDDVSQKNTIYVKKTILGILQHVVMKMENI